MKIAVLTESAGAERRVAITPDAAKRFVGLGAEVCIQAGAGAASRFLDDAYIEAGAKIIDGAIPCFKVYEDDNVLAILDAFPMVEGHTLLLPKVKGYCSLLEMPQEAAAAYMGALPKVAAAVKKLRGRTR